MNIVYFVVIGTVYLGFSIMHMVFPRIPELIVGGAGLFSLIMQTSTGSAGSITVQAIASTIIPIVSGIIIFVIRFQVVTTAKSKCSRHKQRFDREWTKVLSQTGVINHSLMLVLRLNTIVSDIAMKIGPKSENPLSTMAEWSLVPFGMSLHDVSSFPPMFFRGTPAVESLCQGRQVPSLQGFPAFEREGLSCIGC